MHEIGKTGTKIKFGLHEIEVINGLFIELEKQERSNVWFAY